MIEWLDGHAQVLSGNIALAVLVTLSAFLTYARIAFESGSLRMPWLRGMIGVGFTLLALRFWLGFYLGTDVSVAPLSLVALGLVTAGYSGIQIKAIRRALQIARVPIVCLQDPEQPCQREDRLQEALLARKAKDE